MKAKLLLILAIAAIVGAAAAAMSDRESECVAALTAAVVILAMLYRAMKRPMRAVDAGIDLLASQDFASRLRKVGQSDADKVVDLFNSLMDHMKAERLKNQEQNSFLSKLIEASPMGIAICDFDGKVESANAAFRRMECPMVIETLEKLPVGASVTIRPGGNSVLRCSRHYFMDRGFRRPFLMVEAMTDEIVRAETLVFHRIVRTIAHEVNNTLGGVISLLESLADIHADEPEIAEPISGCRDSCVNLGDFVRGYSDVVKLPEPEPRHVNLREFADNLLPFLRLTCPDGITVETRHSGNDCVVEADPMLLRRVVENAVKNSCESISSGSGRGLIVIHTDGRILEIIDDGPGIAADDAAKVFTPFFSTKRVDRGLGLMLISDILRKHNASFTLTTYPAPTAPTASIPAGPNNSASPSATTITTLSIKF